MKLETIFKHRHGTGLNGLFFSAPPHLRGIIGSMIGRGQTQSLAKVVPLSGGADWAGPGVDAEEEDKIFEVVDDEEEKPLVLSEADAAKLKGLNEKLEKVDALILSENTKYPRDIDVIQDLEDKKKLIVARINRIRQTRETLNKPSMLSVSIPKPTTKLIGSYASTYTDITFSTLNGIEPAKNIKNYIGGGNKAWENRVADDGYLLKNICGFKKKYFYTEPFGKDVLEKGQSEKTPYDLFVSETNSEEEAITNKGFFIECKKYNKEVVIFDLWEEYKNKIQMYIYGIQTQAATLNVADRKEFLKIFQTGDKFDIAKINLNFYRDCPDYPGIIIGLNKTPFLKGKYKETSPTYPEIYREAYKKGKEDRYRIPLQSKKGNLSFESVIYKAKEGKGEKVIYESGEYGLIFAIACRDGALFCNYFDIFKRHGIEYEEALNIFSVSRTFYVSSGLDINSFKLPINEFFTFDLTVSREFIKANPKKIADRQIEEITKLLKSISDAPKEILLENKDLIYKALTQFPLKPADRKIITKLFKLEDLFTEVERKAISAFLDTKIEPMYYSPFNNLIKQLTAIIPRK